MARSLALVLLPLALLAAVCAPRGKASVEVLSFSWEEEGHTAMVLRSEHDGATYWTVTARPLGGWSKAVFDGVPAGRYRVALVSLERYAAAVGHTLVGGVHRADAAVPEHVLAAGITFEVRDRERRMLHLEAHTGTAEVDLRVAGVPDPEGVWATLEREPRIAVVPLEAGRARFEGVPAGDYELAVRGRLRDLPLWTQEVSVEDGEHAEVAVSLDPHWVSLDVPPDAEVLVWTNRHGDHGVAPSDAGVHLPRADLLVFIRAPGRRALVRPFSRWRMGEDADTAPLRAEDCPCADPEGVLLRTHLGHPLGRRTFAIQSIDGVPLRPAYHFRTNDDAAVECEDLPVGRLLGELVSPNGPLPFAVDVPCGAVRELVLELRP